MSTARDRQEPTSGAVGARVSREPEPWELPHHYVTPAPHTGDGLFPCMTCGEPLRHALHDAAAVRARQERENAAAESTLRA